MRIRNERLRKLTTEKGYSSIGRIMASELLAYRQSGALEGLWTAHRCLVELYPATEQLKKEHEYEFYAANKALATIDAAIGKLEAIEKGDRWEM
jgi:hypothetical protein